MPFTRTNVKFTVLVIGVVMMVLVGVVGVVAISFSPKSDSTPLYTAVTGFITIAAGQLLQLLRTEQLHVEVQQDKDATERVENKVSKVERHLNGGSICPADPQELAEKLRPLITEIVEEVCNRRIGKPPSATD